MTPTDPAKMLERLPTPARRLFARLGPALRAPRAPVVAAAVVLAYTLFAWPLWEDEVYTWFVSVTFDFAKLMNLVRADPHPPGYFTLTWIVGRLGSSDAWLRLPSVLAALGAVAVLGRLGRRLGVGATAAWVLALLPFFAVYGAMARPYALTLLGGAVLLAASLEMPVRRGAAVVAVTGAALLHLHYMTALPTATALLALAARGYAEEGPHGARWAAAAGLGIGLAFVPWWVVGASAQMTEQSDGPVDPSVLAYLLWPVGRLVPYAAAPLAAIAAVGAWSLVRAAAPGAGRWARLAWVGGAVLLPLAASTQGMTATKLYVFTPYLPLFAVAAAAGLRAAAAALQARVGGARAAVVGALFAVLPAADAVTLLSWEAAPVELAVEGSGTHDPRDEVELLLQVEPTLNPRLIDDRPWTSYVRYVPNPATIPDRSGASPWYGWRREAGVEAKAMAQGATDPRCLFRFAFTSVIYVAEQRRCAALRAVVAEAAEQSGEAPFVLETARFAAEAGALEEAERLARRAIGGMMSTEPQEFLARRRYDQGDLAGAMEWLEAGAARATRLGLRGSVRELEAQRATLAAQLGDTDARAEAEARMGCAESDAPLVLCRTPIAGWFSPEAAGGGGPGGTRGAGGGPGGGGGGPGGGGGGPGGGGGGPGGGGQGRGGGR